MAIIGLLVNGISAWILGSDHGHDHGHTHEHHDHNRRSAYLHVLADALTSLLAIAALLAGKYAGWQWLDPAMGIVGAILITRWAWQLIKDTSQVLLDQQRSELEVEVRQAIENNDIRISDLHIWSIGPNLYAAIISLVAHTPESPAAYKRQIQARCSSLAHITIEVQSCPTT